MRNIEVQHSTKAGTAPAPTGPGRNNEHHQNVLLILCAVACCWFLFVAASSDRHHGDNAAHPTFVEQRGATRFAKPLLSVASKGMVRMEAQHMGMMDVVAPPPEFKSKMAAMAVPASSPVQGGGFASDESSDNGRLVVADNWKQLSHERNGSKQDGIE
jgi:hypothetical protein